MEDDFEKSTGEMCSEKQRISPVFSFAAKAVFVSGKLPDSTPTGNLQGKIIFTTENRVNSIFLLPFLLLLCYN